MARPHSSEAMISRRVLTGARTYRPPTWKRQGGPVACGAMSRLRPLAASLAAAAVLLGACGSDDAPVASSQTAPSEPVADAGVSTPGPGATDGVAVDGVPEFLDFTAPDLDGSQIVGADYAGQDLVLWFWAPW